MSKKVVVVQLATPNIDSYAKYSVASVNEYCLRHGYTHYIQRNKTIDDLHINWSKIDLLKESLNIPCDYLVLFDADVVIAGIDKSIEDFIAESGTTDTEIMMPRDTYFAIGKRRKRRPPRHIRPNAGFVILRNSETSKEIIQEWLDQARGEGSIYVDMHPRNQLVYWNFVMPKYLDKQVVLPKNTTSNGKNVISSLFSSKPFLYHIMMAEEGKRVEKMKAVYEKFNAGDRLEIVSKQLDNNPEGLIEIKTEV